MFDDWEDIPGYPTLRPCDRPVVVNTRWLPHTGIRCDELPLWVKAGGLQLDHEIPGRQIAWVRRTDGSWIAVVEVTARSGNRRSSLSATLWLPSDSIRCDGPQGS